MNGPHDLGGRAGYGAIPVGDDHGKVFAEAWHARALALTVAAGATGAWNIDASRHSRERLGADYEDYSYYERWLGGLAKLLVEHGIATEDEIAAGRAATDAEIRSARMPPQPPLDAKLKCLGAEQAKPAMRRGGPSLRQTDDAPLYTTGQRVRTRPLKSGDPQHTGHTRLPAYAAGRTGVVVHDHGAHVLPDSNAHFRGESPQRLYCVCFGATQLWGDDADARDEVHLDLWQSYLEPA